MGIHFGVDYYPEHWPRARWETDARLMKEWAYRSCAWQNFRGLRWSRQRANFILSG